MQKTGSGEPCARDRARICPAPWEQRGGGGRGAKQVMSQGEQDGAILPISFLALSQPAAQGDTGAGVRGMQEILCL